MSALNEGYFTALGTPIDACGDLVEKSLVEEIRQQLFYGASGMLVLGSMGMQPSILPQVCARAVRVAANAVSGRAALFAGVMDNSIRGVLARIEALKGLEIDGVVVTTPYYFTSADADLLNFFTEIANRSPYPVYLYDLQVATKQKITYPMVRTLAKHDNIRGIKSADLPMIFQILNLGEVKDTFTPLYSGLDTVDAACAKGISRYLDGMFATTPRNAQALESCRRNADYAGVTRHLRNILKLRDTMALFEIFPSFTVCMNLLGMKGKFNPDYEMAAPPEALDVLREAMREIGEL